MILLVEIATRDIVTGENITYELCFLTWYCYDASHLVLCVAECTRSSEDDRHWLVQSCGISKLILLYQDGIVLHTSVLKDYQVSPKFFKLAFNVKVPLCAIAAVAESKRAALKIKFFFILLLFCFFTNFHLIHVILSLHIRRILDTCLSKRFLRSTHVPHLPQWI